MRWTDLIKLAFTHIFLYGHQKTRYRNHQNPPKNYTMAPKKVERSLAHMINNDAAIIYFHHGLQSFTYLIGSDRAKYQEEMTNLKRNIRDGHISSITAGEPIIINGTHLYPMDVRVDNSPCYPYMLLRRRGRYEDADNTPYFFRSRQKRDRNNHSSLEYGVWISSPNFDCFHFCYHLHHNENYLTLMLKPRG